MLPKQTLPIFDLTVPSTGKKLQFRQFTVREEKYLAQAQQSEDYNVIANAIKEVISACVKDIGNTNKLALFDVEYIMTKIRSKSVGENIDLMLECEADPTHRRSNVRINLDKIQVKVPEGHSKNIRLYGDVGVTMRYPTLDDLQNFENISDFDAAVACIESIYTQDEVFQREDQTTEEVVEFLSGLTSEQFEKINNQFFKTMPVFEYEFSYKCVECGHQHNKHIKGLANFFV